MTENDYNKHLCEALSTETRNSSAACNYELYQEATAEERLKEEIETFKGNLSIQSCKLKLI